MLYKIKFISVNECVFMCVIFLRFIDFLEFCNINKFYKN